LRRPVVVALLAGLWLLATGPAAGAHAVLRSSDPASGTALDRAPQAVTITFSEVPDPKVSRIRVLDTTGRSMDAGPATPVPGRPTQLRATLGELPRGVYTVSWRVLSKTDGHVTAGVFAFGIGVKVGAVPAAREATAVTSPPPNRLGVVGRWAFYWGLVLLVGAAATGLLVFDRRLHGPWRPLLAGGLGLAVVGLVAMALAERADVGVPFGELLDSSAGEGLIRQGVALLVTAAVLALYLARPRAPALLAALGVSAAAAMAAHVAAGHAAGQSSARWLNLLAQTVHVVAVGAWVGGLVWLLAGVSGDRGGGDGEAVLPPGRARPARGRRDRRAARLERDEGMGPPARHRLRPHPGRQGAPRRGARRARRAEPPPHDPRTGHRSRSPRGAAPGGAGGDRRRRPRAACDRPAHRAAAGQVRGESGQACRARQRAGPRQRLRHQRAGRPGRRAGYRRAQHLPRRGGRLRHPGAVPGPAGGAHVQAAFPPRHRRGNP